MIIYKEKNKLYSLNLFPGISVYFERLIKVKGREYREWDPRRSKLGAAILKNIKLPEFNHDLSVLYLGAATGTTVSHVSDLCSKGIIFAVEFSPEVFRELLFLSRKRKNIFPILADANQVNQYYHRIFPVDILYQDIAQRNQVEIFDKNTRFFLKKNGCGILCVKARSIDVSREPQKIYNEVKMQLKQNFKILDQKNLNPFQRDHMMFVVRKY